MEIDKKKILDKFTSLNEKDFKAKLIEALAAAGANNNVQQKIMSNIPQLKKALESMSQEDLDLLANNLGDDKLKQILNSINDI